MGIDGNKTADQLAMARLLTSTYRTRACPWHIFKGCHGSDQGLDKQQIKGHWQAIHGQRQAMGFLNRPSAKRAEEFLNLTRNQLRIMTGQFIFKDIETGACRLSWL